MKKLLGITVSLLFLAVLVGCSGGLTDTEKNHLEAHRNHMEQVKKEFENRPKVKLNQPRLSVGETAIFDDCDLTVSSIDIDSGYVVAHINIKAYLEEADVKLTEFQLGIDYPTGSSFRSESIHVNPGEEIQGTVSFYNNGGSEILVRHNMILASYVFENKL